MIQHFIKLTFRNLSRNKVYVLINILGMGLALATCITAYLNYDFGVSFDRNHKNIDKLYKIHVNKMVQGDLFPYGITPQALGPSLEGSSSAIQKVSRYNNSDLMFKKGDEVIKKHFGFVDDDYLEMFTYPLKYGDPNSIKEPGNVLLSSELATLLYEDRNPVGELIKFTSEDNIVKSLKVTGVLEPIPENTSMQANGFINFDEYLSFQKTENINWEWFVAGTFIYVENPADLSLVKEQLQPFVSIQNASRDDWQVHNYELIPMTNLGNVARDIWSNWLWSAPHPAAVMAPPLMALLLLLIACFNFTNTSIAISSRRLQEIGLRKVMGSNRKQLVVQFMTENLVLCFLGMLLGMVIATWLVPAYSSMWEGMTLVFDPMKDYGLIMFLLILLVVTAVLAGAYPSLYISSYEPVSILNGSFKISGSKKFTYTLLTAQYALTAISLFASLAFMRNAIYQKEMDKGYNVETIAFTQVSDPEDVVLLRNALAKDSRITSIGVGNHHIRQWTYSRTLKAQDQEVESQMFAFGEGYIETMGLEIIKGRAFDQENEEYDKKNAIIVNETLASQFGWDEPLGQWVSVNDTTRYKVIGVVKDFYHNGLWDKISPLGIVRSSGDYLRFVVARTNLADVGDVLDLMKSEMMTIAPDKPFRGDYQEELMKESLDVNYNIVIIFTFLGIISIVLSSIGLYTLVSLSLQKRIKEIGIRKVLGASILSISNLMNRNFVIMLVIASMLGTAAGVFVIEGLISSIFVYYKAFDALTVGVPIVMIITLSLIVSYGRIYQSATRNPAESLRYE